MRFLFSLLLIMVGLFGATIFFSSTITITSSMSFVDGMELSMWLGAFSILMFINGVFNLFSGN
jgi:hypothetical protein